MSHADKFAEKASNKCSGWFRVVQGTGFCFCVIFIVQISFMTFVQRLEVLTNNCIALSMPKQLFPALCASKN